MREIQGDLWTKFTELYTQSEYQTYLVIPINGDVNISGKAVMGRGVAAQASARYKRLALDVGILLSRQGLKVNWIKHSGTGRVFVVFPVKYHWWERASLELIERSTDQLQSIILDRYETFILPRPGCGNGRLDWKDVKPIVSVLPDNVIIISRVGEV